MRVRAVNTDGQHPEGWFGDMALHAANPEDDNSEGEVFDIPDEPKHDGKKCLACKAHAADPSQPKCGKKDMPELFSPLWMEEVPQATKLCKRWMRMTVNGGMGAFKAAQNVRERVVIGADMRNGKKVAI